MAVNRTARALREDLAAVDAQTAAALLREYEWLVQCAVQKYKGVASAAFHGTSHDFEDLAAIARAAVLEAYVTYREGDASKEQTVGRFGGGMTTWVRQVICWRLSDEVHQLHREMPRATQARRVAGLEEHVPNGWGRLPKALQIEPPEHEALLDHVERRRWLRCALGQLPPRQRMIMAGLARGETQTQLAHELGLSRTTVHQEHRRALDQLRLLALEAGFGVDLEQGHA